MATARKTAFISGSARNIGRAIALRLARDGFNIVVNGSRNRAACDLVVSEVRQAGVDAIVAMGNVGSSADVRTMAREVLDKFGRVDVLVNNAAIRPRKSLLEMSDEDWDQVISVDLNGAFYLSRAFLPKMVDAGWGRIINMAGMNAIHGYAGRAPVSAAKHGVSSVNAKAGWTVSGLSVLRSCNHHLNRQGLRFGRRRPS